jgi:hypothetical protein
MKQKLKMHYCYGRILLKLRKSRDSLSGPDKRNDDTVDSILARRGSLYEERSFHIPYRVGRTACLYIY